MASASIAPPVDGDEQRPTLDDGEPRRSEPCSRLASAARKGRAVLSLEPAFGPRIADDDIVGVQYIIMMNGVTISMLCFVRVV